MKIVFFKITKLINTTFINNLKGINNSYVKNYKNYSAHQSEVIVVIGGDGFMLQTLKKYQKQRIKY